jgi:hypothetical protein
MDDSVLEVHMDISASEGEIQAVRQAFKEAGLSAQVEAQVEFRSAGPSPGVIEVAVATAGIFFGGFVGAAGADAWKGLRDLIAKLYHAREPARKGSIAIRVKEVRERIIFKDGLPDAAFREIEEMEIRHTNSGQIQWDDPNGEWRDSWDVGKKPDT